MEVNISKCFQIDNISTTQDADRYGYSISERIYSVGFLPLVACAGALINCAFIFVVSRVPRMHTSTNCYLINLAIADVVFLLTGVSEKLYRYHQSPIHGDDTPIRSVGCAWIYLIVDTAYFVSLCFVSLVSIERYLAVCKPQTRCAISKQKTCTFVILSWVISISLAAALTPANNKFEKICLLWPKEKRYVSYPDSWGICTAARSWVKAYGDGMQTIPFFVTLAINGAMYILIIRGLNHSVNRLKHHSDRTVPKDSRMRDQIARMLVINGVAFFICLAPFEILSFINMILTIQKKTFNSEVLTSFVYSARALAYINCVINPVIYTTMSQRYRRAFQQAFCRSKRSNPTPSSTTKNAGSTTQENIRMVVDSRL